MPDKQAEPGDEAQAPHYHGHRQRLRERFRRAGGASLNDYELLELLLFAGLVYFVICYSTSLLVKRFQKRKSA